MYVYEIIQLYSEMFFTKFANILAIHLSIYKLNNK